LTPKESKELTRRQWLGEFGAAAAGGVAMAGVLHGCGDAPLELDAKGTGPSAQATGRPAKDDSLRPEDATLNDNNEPVADESRRTVPGPEPQLKPLRGDGSHPFHYLDTLVIVQMENRSFDHYFGSLSLVEGRNDVDGLSATMSNPDLNGLPVPVGAMNQVFDIYPDPAHDREASLLQWNGGLNDGFMKTWEPKLSVLNYEQRKHWAMNYYQRDDLPVLYELADAFTLCQRWHASLLGPTWPNRAFSHAATSDGAWANDTLIQSPTPYPALRSKRLSVATYYTSLNFLLTIPSAWDSVDAFKLADFYLDAANGTLPNVSVVEPEFFMGDDHPPADIRYGQAFLGSIYEAMRSSPQWQRSLLVVFYDEHGGFYDHVAPPTVSGESRMSEGFSQLGFRVPAVVAGPLVRRGHVLNTVLDHASVPALMSNMFEVPHVNARSELAGNIGDALDIGLITHAERPAAPELSPVSVPNAAISQVMQGPCGQQELLELATYLGKWGPRQKVERLRHAMGYLEHAEALGALRLDG
jgi:phospholipase C